MLRRAWPPVYSNRSQQQLLGPPPEYYYHEEKPRDYYWMAPLYRDAMPPPPPRLPPLPPLPLQQLQPPCCPCLHRRHRIRSRSLDTVRSIENFSDPELELPPPPRELYPSSKRRSMEDLLVERKPVRKRRVSLLPLSIEKYSLILKYIFFNIF
jgi:hypothetical protein